MEKEAVRLPTKEELAKLPHEAIVAYAVRNALRVFPLLTDRGASKDVKKLLRSCAASFGWAALFSVVEPSDNRKRLVIKAATSAATATNAAAYAVVYSPAATHATHTAAAAAIATDAYANDTSYVADVAANNAVDAADAWASDAANAADVIIKKATLKDFEMLAANIPVQKIYFQPLYPEVPPWFIDANVQLQRDLPFRHLYWISDLYTRLTTGRVDDDLFTLLTTNAPEFCKDLPLPQSEPLPTTSAVPPGSPRKAAAKATKKSTPSKKQRPLQQQHQSASIDEEASLTDIPDATAPPPPSPPADHHETPSPRERLHYRRHANSTRSAWVHAVC